MKKRLAIWLFLIPTIGTAADAVKVVPSAEQILSS